MSSNSIISISPFVRKTLVIAGIEYGLGKIGRSYFVMNMETETWRSFTSKPAFNWFVQTMVDAGERLGDNDFDPDPIPVAFEVATVAAAEVATTDHLIRIAAPADVTECVSCKQVITDGMLCLICADKQTMIITSNPITKRIHALTNARRRAFQYPFAKGNAGFARVRQWLTREIARYEARQHMSARRPSFGQKCEIYSYKIVASFESALSSFEAKHGTRPTHVKISKYDMIPANVDVAGMEIERTGAVLPGHVWMGAAMPDAFAQAVRS